MRDTEDTRPLADGGARNGCPPAVNGRALADESFRLLVESVRDYAIFTLDPGGHVMSWNVGAERMKGYTADEIIGRHYSLFYTPEDVRRRRPDENLRRAAQFGRAEDQGWRVRKDGSRFWVDAVFTAMHDPDGRLAGFAKVGRDMTERRRAETALEDVFLRQSLMAAFGREALDIASQDALLAKAARLVHDSVDVDCVSIFEAIPGDGLRLVAGTGWRGGRVGRTVIAAGPESPAGLALAGTPVRYDDLPADERFDPQPLLAEHGVVSGVDVVIGGGHRRRFGSLGVHAAQPRRFGAEEVNFLQAIANSLASALDRLSAEETVRHQAFHDGLTGLANRALFLEHLEQARARAARSGRPIVVMFLDLDRFKAVNDSLGHSAGDELLKEVGRRLQRAVRATDTVARFGGDEFAVLGEDVARESDALVMANRIVDSLSYPFQLEGNESCTTPSVGVVLGDGAKTAADFVRDADAAMYRAKDRGGGRFEVFSGELRRRERERVGLNRELQRAIDDQELRLFYQPEASLETNRVIAVEALVRWQHPERGLVAPGDFIPFAEKTGLIVPLGTWVLEEACRQARRWNDAETGGTPVRVMVNFSARQLHGGRGEEIVVRAIEAAGIEPQQICLEITESVLLEGTDANVQSLRRLKQLGVEIALDDFGTGYSSLSYLTQFPIGIVKVDRSFVTDLMRNPGHASIVEGIIALTRALGLSVIAEGVEDAGTLDELVRMGCPIAQGFCLARPAPADVVGELLATPLHCGSEWDAGSRVTGA